MVPDIVPPVSVPKPHGDRITPHKISVLAVIKEFCVIKMKINCLKPNELEEAKSWMHTTKQNREMAITLLKLIQSPDMDLKQLDAHVEPVFHPITYKTFVKRLQDLREGGITGILDYIQALEPLLVDPLPTAPVVHKSSVVGLFIRRMLLAFDKLSFSQVTRLCHKFYGYYDTAFAQPQFLDFTDSIVKMNTMDCDKDLDISDEEDDEILASQKQAELFIAKQVALLQINENKALSPQDLRYKIRDLLKGNPNLTEAHYLSFLNYLRVKEYCSAVENLCHHFDRNTSVPFEPKNSATSDDASRSFRYAALNLAMLHAKFGHRELALAALKEAIMVAQEVNDNVCLQHALTWLYKLNPGNSDILIERSVSKSGELNLWYLSSLGIQALSKNRCLTTALPISVFDIIVKGDILNCQHSMTDAMGMAYALRAALWTHYGNRCMSNLVCELLLHLNTADPVKGGIYNIGEGTCIAIRNLAAYFADQGEYSCSTVMLQLAHQLFPAHSERSCVWKLCELVIAFKKALNSGSWVEADRNIAGIEILDPIEARYRTIQLMQHQGNLPMAFQKVKKLGQDCESSDISPHLHVRILLLKASILCETPNYAQAIPYLMTCLDICKSHHMMYLHALTTLYIAGVQLMLKLPSKALRLLDSVFVYFLSHGTAYHKGCCYLLYAKSLAAVTLDRTGIEKKHQDDQLAAVMCRTAISYFTKVKAIHKIKYCYCWLAHHFNRLKAIRERNEVAHEFSTLDQQQQPSNNWSGIVVP